MKYDVEKVEKVDDGVTRFTLTRGEWSKNVVVVELPTESEEKSMVELSTKEDAVFFMRYEKITHTPDGFVLGSAGGFLVCIHEKVIEDLGQSSKNFSVGFSFS